MTLRVMKMAGRARRAGWRLLWVLGGGWLAATAAQAGCARALSLDELAPQWTVRLDNDLLSGTGQDRGYTNGFMVKRSTRDLQALDADCLPALARWLEGAARALGPLHVEQRNVTVMLGQALFTPTDPQATQPVPGDRPYAGVLLAGLGHNLREGDTLHVSQFYAGWVGPAALGKASQRLVHRLIGSTNFRGWDHQLRNEPVLMVVHERLRRLPLATPTAGAWRSDAIGHVGASLGNLMTDLNVGVEWRWGRGLPDDFGTHPMRPAGSNTTPGRASGAGGGDRDGEHVFVSLDGQWVGHDLTLDGNTWHASPRVERRPWVAEMGLGFSVSRDRWRLTFSRYLRTREFDGQAQRPALGSVTVGYRFE